MNSELNHIERLFKNFATSTETYSQLGQDIFVLFCLGKKPGFFVEFGACDGIILSNTFLLETYYGWNGILAEPSKHYNQVLRRKRDCVIEDLCISDKTGDVVKFIDVENFQMVSGMKEDAFKDNWSDIRNKHGVEYEVNTISLKDLLDKYDAPNIIDYISIDTEGSEYKILKAYDFSREFNVLTIEHNHTENKNLIESLLPEKGYVQILHNQSRHDAWFVSKSVYEELIKRNV
jgi:FkbM family methyltransferase